MKKAVFILIAATVVFCHPATASEESKYEFNEVRFKKIVLNNGLTAILSFDKSAPTVAVTVRYDVGSKNEISTRKGYANFVARVAPESTENAPNGELREYISETGGKLRSRVTCDATEFQIVAPPNSLEPALWAQAQIMRKAKFKGGDVETQRAKILEEIPNVKNKGILELAIEKSLNYFFDGSSYGWSPLGSEKTVVAASNSVLKNFYETHYQPNNAVISISGYFDARKAEKWIREYFAEFKKSGTSNDVFINPYLVTNAEREFIEKKNIPSRRIYVSYICPSIKDTNYYALSLLADIITYGENVPMKNKIIIEKELAEDIKAKATFFEQGGLFMFTVTPTDDADIEDLEEILYKELRKIHLNGIKKSDLQKAKLRKESEFVLDVKEADKKAELLAKYESLYGKPEKLNDELSKYYDTTKKDLKDAARIVFGGGDSLTLFFAKEGD